MYIYIYVYDVYVYIDRDIDTCAPRKTKHLLGGFLWRDSWHLHDGLGFGAIPWLSEERDSPR